MTKYLFIILTLGLLIGCSSTPDDVVFNAESEFAEANEDIEGNHLEDARQKLENIIRMDTEYTYAPLAQLRIGDSYVKSNDPDLAIEEYRRFLDTYPRHKYAAYAQYQIGIVYFDMVKGPGKGYGAALNALEAFDRLNEFYPRNPYRENASIKKEQSIKIITEHEMRVGEFYFKRTAYNGAIDRLTGLIRDFPKYIENPDLLRMLAVSYKGIDDDAKSDEYMTLLKEKYPDSKYVKKAKKQISKLKEE